MARARPLHCASARSLLTSPLRNGVARTRHLGRPGAPPTENFLIKKRRARTRHLGRAAAWSRLIRLLGFLSNFIAFLVLLSFPWPESDEVKADSSEKDRVQIHVRRRSGRNVRNIHEDDAMKNQRILEMEDLELLLKVSLIRTLSTKQEILDDSSSN
ncbi:hypothetical protein PIB30_021717 [Stylosanthes scabra]|uniref:Uncharacterized protein n=1 Tax=Stylosanthes scabra TaxID=79078 RepID=A0ABU6S8E3_9FABA|nr:hypothetical protein [Stylosanthes scabra]